MEGGSRLSPTEHQKTAPLATTCAQASHSRVEAPHLASAHEAGRKENEYAALTRRSLSQLTRTPPASATSAAATTANATGRCAGSGAGRDRRAAAATAPPPPEPVPEPEPPPPTTPEPPPPPKFPLPAAGAASTVTTATRSARPRQVAHLRRALTGSTHEFDVTGADNVRALKQMITSRVGTPPEQFRLIYEDQILRDDGKTLSEYDVEKQSILRCSPEMSEQCWSLPRHRPGRRCRRHGGSGRSRYHRRRTRAARSTAGSPALPPTVASHRRLERHQRPGSRMGRPTRCRCAYGGRTSSSSPSAPWSNITSFVCDAYVPDLHSLLSSTSTLQLTPTRRRSLRPSHENERQEQRSREKLKPLKPMDKKVIRSQIKRLGRTMPSSVSLPALLPPASRLDAIGPGSSPSARETSLEANKPFSFFGPVAAVCPAIGRVVHVEACAHG